MLKTLLIAFAFYGPGTEFPIIETLETYVTETETCEQVTEGIVQSLQERFELVYSENFSVEIEYSIMECN